MCWIGRLGQPAIVDWTTPIVLGKFYSFSLCFPTVLGVCVCLVCVISCWMRLWTRLASVNSIPSLRVSRLVVDMPTVALSLSLVSLVSRPNLDNLT